MFNMGNFPCSSVSCLSLFLAYSCPGDVAQIYSKFSIRFSILTGLEFVSSFMPSTEAQDHLTLAYFLREKATFHILSGFLLSLLFWPF